MTRWLLLVILLSNGCTLAQDVDDLDAEFGAPPSAGRVPPPPPEEAGRGDGDGPVDFAITKIFVGDTLRDFTESVVAHEAYGYNIDGKISSSGDVDVCRPHFSALDAVHADGDGGVDNSWGGSLLEIYTGVDTAAANVGIAAGDYTLLLRIEDLGAQPNYLDLQAYAYQGTGRVDGSPPSWSVTEDSLSFGGDRQWPFADGYVNNNTFVSGTPADLRIVLVVPPTQLVLTLSHAVVTMKLSADRSSAVDGIISGIIRVEDLVAATRDTMSRLNSCVLVDDAVGLARESVDILPDGKQDPNVDCHAVSVGLGFEAERVEIAEPGAPVTFSLVDTCAP